MGMGKTFVQCVQFSLFEDLAQIYLNFRNDTYEGVLFFRSN